MKVIAYKKKDKVCIETTIAEDTYIKKVLNIDEAEALLRELKSTLVIIKKNNNDI